MSAAPLALAERIIALFAEGAFSATYKHALLLGLLDLCFEKTSRAGVPPTSVTTRELAEQVLQLYWPQCVPWEDGRYLRQGGGTGEQAEIVSRIISFRERLGRSDSQPLTAARRDDPKRFEALLDFVEWKLIEMPIPRLQVLGRQEQRFLYEYQWDAHVRAKDVKAYQAGLASGFDNTLKLLPGVAEGLISLNGLLRPLIQHEWLVRVQQFNGAPETRLDTFLFDRDRQALAAVRGPLSELQAGRCFFCDDALRSRGEVDHFIPWARFPNDAVENLVVAHQRCNNAKRDFLAAAPHVERWSAHLSRHQPELIRLGGQSSFASATARSLGIAAATYLRLPEGALVWVEGSHFTAVDRTAIASALKAA